MIVKSIEKHTLSRHDEIKQNLQYWLSRPAQERLEAVEFYRKQVYGDYSNQRMVHVKTKRTFVDIEALKNNIEA